MIRNWWCGAGLFLASRRANGAIITKTWARFTRTTGGHEGDDRRAAWKVAERREEWSMLAKLLQFFETVAALPSSNACNRFQPSFSADEVCPLLSSANSEIKFQRFVRGGWVQQPWPRNVAVWATWTLRKVETSHYIIPRDAGVGGGRR